MKVLLTGATGFLGSHLAKALHKEGHQVIILKRSFSNIWRIEEVLPQLLYYDLDQCELERPFRDHGKIDVVIHTATCYGRKGESSSTICEVNTAFSLRLLETATLFNTDTFFNTDTTLCKYLNFYTLSKKHFMEWGKQFSAMGKIRFINIKLEHIYGSGDDNFKFTTYVIKGCLKNVPELKLTAGEQKRDFIYVDDVVSAYSILLQKIHQQSQLYKEYDLGSGRAISIREFVETVHCITQSKTILNFGALPYRDHEIMESQANVEPLKALGWFNKISLSEGIEAVIKEEGKT